MEKSKVLMIGVDAATFDLIDPWVAEGVLPNFQRLMENGTRATLWSVPNMNSAPAWTSFATGKNPGKHGIYYFTHPKRGTYEMQVINGSFRDGLTFWQIASQYGKQVGVINVPMTYPADAVDGFVISGVDTPGKHASGWTFPRDLMEQIPQELGEYILEPGLPTFIRTGRLDKGLDVAYQTIAQRTRYSLYLMQSFPWDLFVTVYTTIDALQHYFWQYMLLSDGATLQEDRLPRAIRDAYIHVDQGIGELVQRAPPGTTVIIVSDHGAGPTLHRFQKLPDWLLKQRYLRTQDVGSKPTAQACMNSLLHWGYQWIDAHFSREFKKLLSRKLPNVRNKVEAAIRFGQVDWSRTRLYTTSNVGPGLRVNLKGREPQGIVEPGDEYEALCDEVIAALLEWREPASGVKMVADVKRREEIYVGPHLAEAADLLIYWNYEGEDLSDFVAPSLQARQFDFNSWMEIISGSHRPNGILIAYGPEIQPRNDILEAHIWDVAPTILYTMGLPILKDMDGKLLRGMFVERVLVQRPPEYVDPESTVAPSSETLFNSEDEEVLKERLRGLGYIE